MLTHEKGTLSGSEEFHPQPSEEAKGLLYYVTGCGIYFCEYGYRVERENYGNYMLLYVREGVLTVTVNDTTYLVQKGEVAFFDCHAPHTYYAKGYTSFQWIHFDGANTEEFCKYYFEKRGTILCDGVLARAICHNMTYIISRYRNHQEIHEDENSRWLYDCLYTLLFAVTVKKEESNQGGNVITLAQEYIRQNIKEDLTLEKIAEYVHLSSSHFSRIFKKETGYSPYEYILLVRINKAKHLLRTTRKSVKDIAFAVGYRSESNFCNSFTQRVGVSPSGFRKFNW